MSSLYTEEQIRSGEHGSYEEAVSYFTRHTDAELREDYMKLRLLDAGELRAARFGNTVIDHFQMRAFFRTTRERKETLEAILSDPEKRVKWWKSCKRDPQTNEGRRLAEHWFRITCITAFRPSIAKSMYQRFGATHVLDPTAGWGGRMLGAAALDIAYTGIDTNLDLKAGYDGMMALVGKPNLTMLWQPCLEVDFSEIDYDMVLTSPPYVNKEVYQHMKRFESERAFYVDFLIPLLRKCLAHIRRDGWVFFNIDPAMYRSLLIHGFPEAHEQIGMPNERGEAKEFIYGWRNRPAPARAPAAPPPPATPATPCAACPDCAAKDEQIAALRAALKALL